ncbi:ATP-dependent RNA helicase DbpA [Endozoicomonas gorgoniicola]|uniref:ATP-dependent RNA helicase DbpA n=1 Tax=Endozoicomonas gorgoniicola TaxID=1234144 RepID=A0ABT3N0R9_9GAMM|nr:ATP-dependent RNA helicase DbpA [Endozoicomonas gorgoniicola]MCW7554804.1 ATP-dependent RNA helicase DbpA [Endozoicomonas gorgoniicola]
MSQALFSSLPLPPALLTNLKTIGYQEMTAIQQQSLPLALDGKDLIAKAKTGSGKTAAFSIPMLTKIRQRFFGCQALVLCPTRELATQVANEIRRLARYQQNIKVVTLCGGQPIGPQIGSLAHGAHIVVGTPGRIQDHLRKRTLCLEKVSTLVLDEADRMLDMGFIDAIENIIDHTPGHRQTLLFSATYPKGIRQLSDRFQNEPEEVTVESVHSHQHIAQSFYQADHHEKPDVLHKLLAHHQPSSSVIFCNTKQVCKDVGVELYNLGYKPLVLHGDMDQKERDQMLVRFSNQSSNILIATDVAARGLDIDDLACVINYDLSRDPEVHVHRIGRTGRAGKEGLAFSLYTSKEHYKLERIADILQSELSESDPSHLPKPKTEAPKAPMVTLAIDGGRKHKVRPGDILGALTGDAGIAGDQVGKINVFDFVAYVAIKRESARKALSRLEQGKIKGRKFKVRRI